jgi:hypothetical protein
MNSQQAQQSKLNELQISVSAARAHRFQAVKHGGFVDSKYYQSGTKTTSGPLRNSL